MRRSLLMLGALVLSMGGGAIIACSSSDSNTTTDDGDAGDEAGDPGTNPTPDTDGGLGNAGTGAATGLPCDVQALLENRCLACHDGTMVAAPPLNNYNDLIAKSKADPTKNMAQETLVRMQSATSPMPPKPAAPPDPDEIAAMAVWVDGGTPENKISCTTAPPPSGEGGADSGSLDGGLDGASPCTSRSYWDGGNTKSPLMNPGEACSACHQVMGGPNLLFAGTVYKTAHEPDLCNGQSPPPTITVTITDVNKRTVKGVVNNAGNFDIPKPGGAPLKAPFKASLSDGVATRAMVGTVTSGDCNSCHTVAGKNGAPGRILAP